MGRNSPQQTQLLRSSALPLLAAVLAFLLFAGQFVVSKHGIQQGLTPYDITGLRFGVAGLISLPFLIRWGIADLAGVGWARSAVLATLVGFPGVLLMIGGLSFAPAAHIVVINPGMTLIGGTLLSALWLRESISSLRMLAGLGGLTGLVFIGWQSFANPSNATWIGDLMFGLSGLVWALYMTLLHRWQIDPLKAAILVASLSVVYVPVYWFAVSPDFSGLAWSDIILQAGYHGIVHSLIAMVLFAYAVRLLGSGQVALMTPIVPVAGLIMAVLLIGERMSGPQWFGAALVCCAMLLAAFHAQKRAAHS